MIYSQAVPPQKDEIKFKTKTYSASDVERVLLETLTRIQNCCKSIASDTKLDFHQKSDCIGVDVSLEKNNQKIKFAIKIGERK